MSDEINIKTKSSKTKIVVVVAISMLAILFVGLMVMSKSATAKKVETQLSLGEKYLSELQYEQAIAAYELAIEIDPKCEDAYLALAEIYIETGEFEKASEILDMADEQFVSKAIWEKQQEVEEATEREEVMTTPEPTVIPIEDVPATSVPTPELVPTPTDVVPVTSIPAPMPTVEPVVTEEPIKTPTVDEVPTPTMVPINTPTPRPTDTPTPRPTNTPTPRPIDTPTPIPTALPTVANDLKRVELKMASDCFTYGYKNSDYVCTGLSEKGYTEFLKYDVSSCVSIILPDVSDSGEKVDGFYSNSSEGYGLRELLTRDSAYIELVCPEAYTVYYGVCDERPDERYASKLMNVVLNEGLEEIEPIAFYECTGLVNVVIPKSVTKIGRSAFEKCSELKEIELPDSVTMIDDTAFDGCEKLVLEGFEMGGKTIGSNAFGNVKIKTLKLSGDAKTEMYTWNDAIVEKIEIADGVKEIPSYAFSYCTSIEEIVIPSTVKKIGGGAFSGCSKIERVEIPNSVEEIESIAFYECTGLESVVIPKSVTKIGRSAFEKCSELKEIELPDSVTMIDDTAFDECEKLVLESFEMGGKTIGSNAFGNVKIKTLKLGGDAKAEMYTWNDAIVEKIEIADGVKEIPSYAFSYCTSIEEIVIPSTVEKIGNGVFSGCKNLTLVVKQGTYADTYAKGNSFSVRYQ